MKGLATSMVMGLCGCALTHQAFKYTDPKEVQAKQDAEAAEQQKRMAALMESIKDIRVGKNDPPRTYKDSGAITAVDGNGYGQFGELGTYEHAIVRLKVKARDLGADYIQIITIDSPHSEPLGFRNAYIISGTAYKSQ